MENSNDNSVDLKSSVMNSIDLIRIGNEDQSGNKIVQVHSKHNEYAIYEIETEDINQRIRVLIDGRTDAREKELTDRFNKVKQNYIKATGMLVNTPNMEMLKRRIAHTLSTCLSGDNANNVNEFDTLIATIEAEHNKIVINRISYISPILILALIFLVLALCNLNIHSIEAMEKKEELYFYCLFLSTSIGACLSILINATRLNFEEYSSKSYYVLLGLERLFLSLFAGVVAFIAIKAGLFFPEFINKSIWGIMVALTLAGFSESLIPSFLEKVNNEKGV